MNITKSQPILHLNKIPKEPLDGYSLFRKFCPNKQGVISVDFQNKVMEIFRGDNEKQGEQLQGRTVLNLTVDPANKLSTLIENNQVLKFYGNASIEDAKVIFLDDTCHPDKNQPLIRGEIANRLKGKENVFLCEGYDSNKISFSKDEIADSFAPNLNLHADESKDYLSGWDESFTHKKSLEEARLILLQKESLEKRIASLNYKDKNEVESTAIALQKIILDADEVINHKSHQRTKALWSSVQQFQRNFPKAKIFVFGGSSHMHEPWLLEQLKKSGTKYCILTSEQKVKEEQYYLKDYYHVDSYGLWGNKK
jgi:hypothetical protein